jgi:hypothetical protein
LKVEAAHLRKLPLPMPSGQLAFSLSSLGKKLAKSSPADAKGLLDQVDWLVLEALTGSAQPRQQFEDLKALIQGKMNARKR